MIKDTTVRNDLINKIINIIDIEKGLSKNSKNAYASDIILMNDWFRKQNINFLNAKEIDFKNLFSEKVKWKLIMIGVFVSKGF